MGQLEDCRYVLCIGGLLAGLFCGYIAMVFTGPPPDSHNLLSDRNGSLIAHQLSVEQPKDNPTKPRTPSQFSVQENGIDLDLVSKKQQLDLETVRLKKLIADQATDVSLLQQFRR